MIGQIASVPAERFAMVDNKLRDVLQLKQDAVMIRLPALDFVYPFVVFPMPAGIF
jgi:hypothetical protein